MYMPETLIYYKQYIKRVIVTDWTQVAAGDVPARNDHYSDALHWLSEHKIYTSDLTMEGLMGMVASHSILFEEDTDLLAFTLVFGDLIQ
jgi:hypothetical protein